MSVLQRDGMHAWGQIGNTAGKPFWVFTEKRVSSVQDGFVFTFIFGHFLGKLGFRVKFSLQAQSPCGLGGTQCRHQCRSPESQTFGTSSCWGGPGPVLGPWGRMWGQRTRCATSQAWCHGAQLFSNGREGCQKQLIYAISSQPNNRTRIARTLTPGTRRPLWKHETAHGICFYALCNFYPIQLFIVKLSYVPPWQ